MWKIPNNKPTWRTPFKPKGPTRVSLEGTLIQPEESAIELSPGPSARCGDRVMSRPRARHHEVTTCRTRDGWEFYGTLRGLNESSVNSLQPRTHQSFSGWNRNYNKPIIFAAEIEIIQCLIFPFHIITKANNFCFSHSPQKHKPLTKHQIHTLLFHINWKLL